MFCFVAKVNDREMRLAGVGSYENTPCGDSYPSIPRSVGQSITVSPNFLFLLIDVVHILWINLIFTTVVE